MATIKKWIVFPLSALSLFIAACSDNKTPAEQNTQSTATEIKTETAQGNWKTKPAELSSNVAADIQADLTAINQITNSMNSRAVSLRKQAENQIKDPTKISETFKSAHDLQEHMKTQIMTLNLKSAEVQQLRIDMLDNLMTANQLYQLSTATDFNPQAPSETVKQLALRSAAIEQKIATELDTLNQKYAK